MRLTKGKSVVAKEFYSSSMQVWLQCMINIVSSLLLLDSGVCEGLYSILVHLLRQEKLACLSLTSEKILPATKDLAVVVTVMWCERRRRSSLAGDVLATQKRAQLGASLREHSRTQHSHHARSAFRCRLQRMRLHQALCTRVSDRCSIFLPYLNEMWLQIILAGPGDKTPW